mmetsp:Transcript_29752/g.54652  ORF Transcript_29752/g.54652 Transcript_29752/m.54652 type:complete len:311 (+) Transcript_29752:1308-2240(+)
MGGGRGVPRAHDQQVRRVGQRRPRRPPAHLRNPKEKMGESRIPRADDDQVQKSQAVLVETRCVAPQKDQRCHEEEVDGRGVSESGHGRDAEGEGDRGKKREEHGEDGRAGAAQDAQTQDVAGTGVGVVGEGCQWCYGGTIAQTGISHSKGGGGDEIGNEIDNEIDNEIGGEAESDRKGQGQSEEEEVRRQTKKRHQQQKRRRHRGRGPDVFRSERHDEESAQGSGYPRRRHLQDAGGAEGFVRLALRGHGGGRRRRQRESHRWGKQPRGRHGDGRWRRQGPAREWRIPDHHRDGGDEWRHFQYHGGVVGG